VCEFCKYVYINIEQKDKQGNPALEGRIAARERRRRAPGTG
jgi:hypothetical protein